MFIFKKVINHQSITNYFSEAVANNRLHHAFLFAGNEGSGKLAMALEWACALNCLSEEQKPCYTCEHCLKISALQYPDVHIYTPTPPGLTKEENIYETMIAIRQKIAENPYRRVITSPSWIFRVLWIREIINSISFKSTGSGKRVFILTHIEQMNQESANVFLKTLEEPPPNVLFILISNDFSTVLPTIKSRCILLQFPPLQDEIIADVLQREYKIPEEEARISAFMSGGSLTQALEYGEEGLTEKQEFAFRLLQAACAESSELIPVLAEEYAKRNAECPVRDILQFLLVCLKEIILKKEIITNNESDTEIYHYKLLSQFDQILGTCTIRGLNEIREEVEKSIDFIEKNVYLYLILLVLIQKIRKILYISGYFRT